MKQSASFQTDFYKKWKQFDIQFSVNSKAIKKFAIMTKK